MSSASPSSSSGPAPRDRRRTLARVALCLSVLLVVAFVTWKELRPQFYDRALTRKYMVDVGMDRRFEIAKQQYLASVRREHPEFSEEQMAVLLTYGEFTWGLAPRVEIYFSPAELTELMEFHADGAGRKKLLQTRDLLERIQRGEMSDYEISAEADCFFASLTPAEKETLAKFDRTSLGERYPGAMNLIYGWFDVAFEAATNDMLTKLKMRSEGQATEPKLNLDAAAHWDRESSNRLFDVLNRSGPRSLVRKEHPARPNSGETGSK